MIKALTKRKNVRDMSFNNSVVQCALLTFQQRTDVVDERLTQDKVNITTSKPSLEGTFSKTKTEVPLDWMMTVHRRYLVSHVPFIFLFTRGKCDILYKF